ncbi:MAG: response regulator transcription factor [Bacteroidales bacterium]|nr:response regulator transcription factor [Bacteroidales bacterium]
MEASHYKILLVDDEEDVLDFLGYNLEKEGFTVFKASDGKEALSIAQKEHPHIILLDVMMPVMDGMEACAAIRNISGMKNTIIMFLTARGEDYSQIAGFDAGADDYVTKPVKPRVLISRIFALLRRIKDNSDVASLIETEHFTINREKYIVIADGHELIFPRKEFEVLALLASRPDKVFTREEIFSAVWGDDVIVGERTIDVHVRKIREKLNIPNIKTVKGVGYKYES